MTKPLSERVAEFAKFDADLYSENSASWVFGAQAENTRLIPLITAMASEIERLRDVLSGCELYPNGMTNMKAKQALTAPTTLDALLKGDG